MILLLLLLLLLLMMMMMMIIIMIIIIHIIITFVFAPPVSWLRECVVASKHPSRLLLVPRGAPGWAPKQALFCRACSCVKSTTHRGPSDDDILESVNPLKVSSVECHLQSLQS